MEVDILKGILDVLKKDPGTDWRTLKNREKAVMIGAMKNDGTVISEKVVRRLMNEEGLVVTSKRRRKYNSYKGEITPAVPNLVNTMLDNLAKKLKDGTKPIILQTEDAITGGLAGLAECRQTAG